MLSESPLRACEGVWERGVQVCSSFKIVRGAWVWLCDVCPNLFVCFSLDASPYVGVAGSILPSEASCFFCAAGSYSVTAGPCVQWLCSK